MVYPNDDTPSDFEFSYGLVGVTSPKTEPEPEPKEDTTEAEEQKLLEEQ